MQTNEIASLLVDCTAQTLCWIPTPGSVEFGSTLAAALETEDGQNLPVGESEPEDLSVSGKLAGTGIPGRQVASVQGIGGHVAAGRRVERSG